MELFVIASIFAWLLVAILSFRLAASEQLTAALQAELAIRQRQAELIATIEDQRDRAIAFAKGQP